MWANKISPRMGERCECGVIPEADVYRSISVKTERGIRSKREPVAGLVDRLQSPRNDVTMKNRLVQF
ncbi:hypothetical protein PHSY_003017 [Pseudozyma hubeiensis SY62]|uniref:Uncharacterized protein n=1 Tax=Pseudozyma hubeiensis (strain SY62) TaxID=1305764 RepID=R9P2A5_PSEHS|nr:hypothetical protein PHSY_003017 [Pseudozyma hubeiensis SY62]GAC95441.1 hypothetical protein PHSY_003017 [Pseudozyma hubeiensis SY62]